MCTKHGGSAPQVVAKARERIGANADLAARQLIALMEDPDSPPGVKLNAARDLLDRAGLTPAQVIQHAVAIKPYERLLSGGIDRTRPAAIDPPIVDAEVVEDTPEPGPTRAERRRIVTEIRRGRREHS